MLLTGRQFVLGEYRLNRTLRLAQRAVDAFVGIDHEEIGPFVKAIHRANLDAVGQFALDAGFCNHECHAVSLSPERVRYAMLYLESSHVGDQ